ncbi:MAG: efflux RND transporter periplasmic adaptor subunit [Bacteroidia bacterium]|nr:efflux RND transporter periplasmic adaptor subunit [Bacteroidia bacterium]
MKAIFPGIRGAGLLLAAAAVACQTPAGNQAVQYEQFPVISPMQVDTTLHQAYVADIQSMQHVELRARTRGYLERLLVDEGEQVREGQLLFVIGNKELQEELRKARALLQSTLAEAKVLEVELENTRQLAEKQIVSQPEYEVAQARLEAMQARADEARAAVSAAELSLSLAQVRAPFAGMINRIPNKTGSLIEEGTLLTEISSNHDVFAYFNVSEPEYLELMRRDELSKRPQVQLQLANGDLHPHPGKLETAATVVDKSTGTIAFRARFPNPGHLLKHGASGKILVPHELKQVLVIPQKSTFEVQDKLYVYVVDTAGQVQMRNFIPSMRLPHLYVVGSGLDAHDRVLFEGIQRVQQGSRITPELVDFRTLMSGLALR